MPLDLRRCPVLHTEARPFDSDLSRTPTLLTLGQRVVLRGAQPTRHSVIVGRRDRRHCRMARKCAQVRPLHQPL